MLTAIDRYILKQVLGPLAATLGVAGLLLILERMLRLFDFVVNEGGPVNVVFRMLGNLAPHYIGLALPIGLFLGVLVAFRRLSLSSELDALLNSGLSLQRLLKPILLLSLLLMLFNIILTGWVQPISRYAYRGLVFDLRSGALGASIRVGEFVEIGDGLVLRIEQSFNQGSELQGIFLEKLTDRGRITVTANRGGFYATDNEQTILLRLYDGTLIDLNERENKPRVLTFSEQDITIKLPSPDTFRARGGEEREMTLLELVSKKNDTTLPDEIRRAINGQFHWRLMHNLTFLVLPLLAIPMGIANKRRGQSTGIVVGLTLLIVYNELMEVMETIVATGVSPYTSIWILFAGFTILSSYFFSLSAFKAGAEPLKFIDKSWDFARRPVVNLARRIMGVSE